MTRMTYAMVALCAVVSAATAFGTVYNVSATWELESAQANLSPGDEIIIQPGTYNLGRSLYITTANVTLRGATGDRDDVIIRGGGMNVQDGSTNDIPIQLRADDITIQDLTVADAYYNGIHIHCENYVDRAIIRNVKTLNIGERHIKGSGSGAASWDVLVEHCMFEQTEARLTRPGHSVDEDDYIGGMDCMSAKNWIIRDNVAKGIVGASGTDARGAIFLWQDVVNPLIERNVIIDCARGFSMGNPYNPNNTYLVDGGIIRNNMILRGVSVAMEFDHTRNIKVYNNTIYSDAANYFRTIQIYDVGNPATTGLEFVNNIIRGGILDQATGTWDVATLTAMGNIVDNTGVVVLPTWFASVAPATADLHLTAQATAAIGAGTTLADAQYDYDQELRGDIGSASDMGADEVVVLAALVSSDPPADGTFAKLANNVIALTFDTTIELPVEPALHVTPIAGGADLGDSFTYSIEPDGLTLKAVEDGAQMTNQTWYRLTPTVALGTQDFAVDVCTLIGDADGNRRVMAVDLGVIWSHNGEMTDARYDINGDGRVMAVDLGVAWSHNGQIVPVKP